MFEATYLGHQGWLVEAGDTRLLIDPLLGPNLTSRSDDPIRIYPPRHLDLAAFPPIDAVVVTHEHPDHLNVPTLLTLDREIPVLLPRRASVAARAILAELGFSTRLLRSGEAVTVGELELHPFHSSEIARDEWDVVPLLVRDRKGDGSLATSIDAPETADFARFAAARAGRLGLWASSHNTTDLFPVREGSRQEPDDAVSSRLARDLRQRFESQFQHAPRPEAVLVLSSGFSLAGDIAWMNRHVFPGRADHLVRLLGQSLRDVRLRAPVPGQRFSLRAGRLAAEAHARPFLSVEDPRDWPPHAAEPFSGEVPDYGPACGRRELPAGDRAEILEELQAFAGHLYGGALMRSLYEGGAGEEGAREEGVAFALRTGSERFVLAYRPEACAFEPADSADPRADFAAGLECWATDLLAVLRFELEAGYLTLGRCRTWNAAPERLRCELDLELALFTHPLRAPARALEQYRRVVADLGGSPGAPRVAFARGATR
jgi:hypothetical protein